MHMCQKNVIFQQLTNATKMTIPLSFSNFFLKKKKPLIFLYHLTRFPHPFPFLFQTYILIFSHTLSINIQ